MHLVVQFSRNKLPGLRPEDHLIMSNPFFATGNFYREASSLLVVVALAATSNNISQAPNTLQA